MSPLVTVLMSVHNGEKYLAEAIDSILCQTWTDFEFIIIDDASTDRSQYIINSFSDTRIQYLKNPTNIGLTRSLNIGLGRAKGKYIARIDADDMSTPDRLEVQVECMAKNDFLLVGSWAYVVNDRGTVIRSLRPLSDPKKISFKLLFANSFVHSSCLFEADAVKSLGGYDEDLVYAQDFDLWSRLSRIGALHNVPEFLCFWRESESSITGSRGMAQKMAAKSIAVENQSAVLGLNINNKFIRFLNSHYGLSDNCEISYSKKDIMSVAIAFSEYYNSDEFDNFFFLEELDRLRLYFIEKNIHINKSSFKGIFLSDFTNKSKSICAFRIIFKKIIGEKLSLVFGRYMVQK
ncbi:MAG: glycosyltransferase [Desulfuromonadales bacterium]|nr:glycosyltransferase [Desulfuromonadales bacterium]